jgi:pimeloyl-ACP methyl ester carboxylesterase
VSGRAPGRPRNSDANETKQRDRTTRRERAVRRERPQTVTRRGTVVLHHEAHGSGPPLVLIHGLCGSTRWWRRNLSALAASHRVYVVDLAGFGGSHASRFVLEDAAATLRGFLAGAGVPRADVIGHSMGGLVAAELAADYPEAVDRLVLVDAAGLPLARSFAEQAFGVLRAAPRIPLGLYPVLVDDTRRAGLVSTLRLAHRLAGADLSRKLGSIAAPTLVVWGEDDTIVPLRVGVALAQAIPHARIEVLPHAGHVPMWETPDTWNRLVLSFLSSRTAVRRARSGT